LAQNVEMLSDQVRAFSRDEDRATSHGSNSGGEDVVIRWTFRKELQEGRLGRRRLAALGAVGAVAGLGGGAEAGA